VTAEEDLSPEHVIEPPSALGIAPEPDGQLRHEPLRVHAEPSMCRGRGLAGDHMIAGLSPLHADDHRLIDDIEVAEAPIRPFR